MFYFFLILCTPDTASSAPKQSQFNGHVPRPECSPSEACRRDGNGQIISHSKYSLRLTAASGLQARCGGAMESNLLSRAKPCFWGGKGVIFTFSTLAIFTLD